MSELSFWIKAAAPEPSAISVFRSDLPAITSVRFARRMGLPRADTIYIGTASDVREALASRGGCRGVTFFASGPPGELPGLARRRQANLVVSDTELFELHDRLSDLAQRYQDWASRMDRAARPGGIQGVVDEAAGIADMPCMLLNAGLRVVYSGNPGGGAGPPVKGMSESDVLSEASARLLFPEGWLEDDGASVLAFRRLGGGSICWMQKVFKNGRLISTMLLFSSEEREDFDAGTLLSLLQKSISGIIQKTGAGGYWAGYDFKTFLEDILARRPTSFREMGLRSALLDRMPRLFCSFILIEFESPGGVPDPATHLLTQMEELFPDSNAALYPNSIVLMLSRPDREFQPTPKFDAEKFSAFLNYYNAFAAISNATSKCSGLRANYLMCRRILQLGKKLRPHPSHRYFLYEDYVDYFIIDLCKNSFHALYNHDDIIYLTHPDVIKLFRYDKTNGTDLTRVLYHYCLNDCNLAKTARSAYMHRNTAASRIAKIQELLQCDFSNGQVQQRLILSYKILRYYERFAQVNLNELLGVRPDGEEAVCREPPGRRAGRAAI